MPKTANFTTITPLPIGITRKSVLDMYRDHMAMIDLNPLVVERFKCRPPEYAPVDEYYSTWYTIKDRVSYLPGGLAQGSVSYHACFDDLPGGLHTHVYAPLGLDIRAKWTVGGTLPGEADEPAEKELKPPKYGLYIREDVEMTCSSLLLGFVKRTFKDSHASLVEQLVERAHLLESTFANERLKALRNVDPGERMASGDIFIAPPPDYLPSEYGSTVHETSSQPPPSPLYRTTPAPHHHSALPLSNHTRSQSDPIASPRLSEVSTLVEDMDRQQSRWKEDDQEIILQFANVDPRLSFATYEENMYLLPAITYDGHSSPHHSRSSTSHSDNTSRSNHSHQSTKSSYSLFPRAVSRQRSNTDLAPYPPRVSYHLLQRPVSFTFPTSESAFDTRNVSALQPSQQNILDEIDDAIDQMQAYHAHPQTPQPTKYEPILPRKAYEPGKQNKMIVQVQAHKRKDSGMPVDTEKELPPLPVGEE